MQINNTAQKMLNQNDRLSYSYKIINKNGQSIDFCPNWAQRTMLYNREHRNLILKCRQIGSTTFWALYLLDVALYFPNSYCGIIAYKMDAAQDIFRRIIKHAVDNLHPFVKQYNPVVADSAREIRFKNGSGIRVDTSMRGGTLTGGLLISEFGKICAQSPDKAKEIITGSLEAVPSTSIVTIESTAEGRTGPFFELWQQYEGKNVVSPSDYQTFFFPWWQDPTYQDPIPLQIPAAKAEYFSRLEPKIGRKLTPEQKYWYVRKDNIQQDNMKSEYPSTSEEAWEGSHEGFYYAAIISELRNNNHITNIPYNPSKRVHTSFDIGIDDHTVVWFFQFAESGTINFIDYKEWSDIGGHEIAAELNRMPYNYGTHIMPHDSKQRDKFTAISYIDQMRDILNGDIYELPLTSILAGIQQVRLTLPRCYFDQTKCSDGIKRIEAYKKEWDDRLNNYRATPLHDNSSHSADSMRYCCLGLEYCTDNSEVTPDWIKSTRASLGYKP